MIEQTPHSHNKVADHNTLARIPAGILQHFNKPTNTLSRIILKPPTQCSSHLVGPLSHSYAAAGFFPKSTEPTGIKPVGAESEGEEKSERQPEEAETAVSLLETGPEQQGQETVYNQTKYWLIEDPPPSDREPRLNRQFLNCVQTMNLRNNFLYWDAKSKVKQKQPKQSTTSASSSVDRSIE